MIISLCVSIFSGFFSILTFKAPITPAAEDIPKYFFIVFSEKIRLDIEK